MPHREGRIRSLHSLKKKDRGEEEGEEGSELPSLLLPRGTAASYVGEKATRSDSSPVTPDSAKQALSHDG